MKAASLSAKDIFLAELEQSFAEKFAAYLKHVKGLRIRQSALRSNISPKKKSIN